MKLSTAMVWALDAIAFSPEFVWYHDIGAATVEALRRRGLVRESRVKATCGTPGHRHIGYLALTPAGA